MALACPGRRAAVIEAKAIELGHAGHQRLEIRQVEQRVLRREAAGHDQQVMIQDVELVQQRNMGLADVGDKQVWVVGKERVGARLVAGDGVVFLVRVALVPVAVLARKAGNLAHQEAHAAIVDARLDGLDRAQRAALQGVLRLAQDGRPQRAGLERSMWHGLAQGMRDYRRTGSPILSLGGSAGGKRGTPSLYYNAREAGESRPASHQGNP